MQQRVQRGSTAADENSPLRDCQGKRGLAASDEY